MVGRVVEGRGTTKQGENTKQSAYTAKAETDIVYLGASLQRTLATLKGHYSS